MTGKTMTWPKPKPNEETIHEDGSKTVTIDTTPHPSYLLSFAEARASHYEPDYVDEALRFFLLMTCINGMDSEIAQMLAKPEHYTLDIDEDSREDVYLLKVRKVSE